MTEQQIVTYQQNSFLSPVVDIHAAIQRYQAMKDFISAVLKESVDYGKIPGTDKNTLLKPGAEKLSSFFGLVPTFQTVQSTLDWTGEDHAGEPFFYFHYRCRLMRGDMIAAEGEGSATSWEKKYRYRSSERVCPKCGKPAIIPGKKEYGGGWLCFAKKGGCGAKFPDDDPEIKNQVVGQIKNPDVADIVNTLQKMAQKRSYVAAVLLAVNGSEYFTQDVEDFVDSEFYEIKPRRAEKEPEPQPVSQYEQEPVPVLEQPQPAPVSMSLETALSVKNSDGVSYGDLDSTKLSHIINGMLTGMKKTGLSDTSREEYLFKTTAIKTILKSRSEH